MIAIASLAESQPLPLLEGMACGCFPVVTNVGIVPEMVAHGVNGLVVERSPEAFRDAFSWCERNLAAVRRAGRLNAARSQPKSAAGICSRHASATCSTRRSGAARCPRPKPRRRAGPLRAALSRHVAPARVAFVTPEFVTNEPRSGGLANYLRRMTTALVRQGHQPELFVIGHEACASIEVDGVRVHQVRGALSGALAARGYCAFSARCACALAAHVLPPLVEAWWLAAGAAPAQRRGRLRSGAECRLSRRRTLRAPRRRRHAPR